MTQMLPKWFEFSCGGYTSTLEDSSGRKRDFEFRICALFLGKIAVWLQYRPRLALGFQRRLMPVFNTHTLPKGWGFPKSLWLEREHADPAA